jgi:hypothetical protein
MWIAHTKYCVTSSDKDSEMKFNYNKGLTRVTVDPIEKAIMDNRFFFPLFAFLFGRQSLSLSLHR